ncbi:MAG: hypothetical protein L3J93_00085 [Thermoplasmata archaeon]|nr:hypothetical protein [Thermoplasmata archaeon]
MSPLFGPSRHDLRRAAQALRELGPTSVAGLAAALTWSERKTEKALHALVRIPGSGVGYDARARAARPDRGKAGAPMRAPALAARSSLPPTGGVSAPTAGIAVAEPSTPAEPAPSWGGRAVCPSCSAKLEPLETKEALVCRSCGRIVPLPRRQGSPALPTGSTPNLVVGSRGPVLDRKAQEMLAAYVTSQPIPCPKCRRPMQHHGVAAYACPACGENIRFTAPALPDLSPASAAAPIPS